MPFNLQSPISFGSIQLGHRVVMAPLTRLRSKQPGNIPWELNVEYYRQRASPGGLLISEASQISPQGQGYPASPGIHSDAQVEGWRKVIDAVHEKGGKFAIQLWHVGRTSHTSFHPEDGLPVAPSAIRPPGETLTADWQSVPYETPRALETAELPGIVATYKRAAENARRAGADGVEIHGANGYLLDQFLQDGTNHREDAYGGSIPNRARLLLEVVDAVTEAWDGDAGRVGVRLSPWGKFGGMSDSNPVALFTYVIEQLSRRGIAYLHLIEPRQGEVPETKDFDAAATFRKSFAGPLLSAGGYTGEEADRAIASGKVDAVAFGRLFISNPDLPKRLQLGAPLNPYDRSTFYGGDTKGYTDYPALA
jgi:N-ethylmaleimide reductase